MWKQLTQKARKAILHAQEEAGKLGYSHAGPEHLLLALVRVDDCVAARILEALGVDPGTVRIETMKHLSRGNEVLGDDMQLTTELREAIHVAFDEAKERNEDWVGTEHLLIGLVSVCGLPSEVLKELGADLPVIRIQLRNLQAGTLPFENAPGQSISVSTA